jgi:hypothetical protein
MRPFKSSLLPALCLSGSLAMTGCAGSMSFPDAPAAVPQTSLGEIHGSVFGGHAPLVGAHVYVIQPGTSGYGSAATSILAAPAIMNSGSTDGNVPTSWYYVTTDSNGAFNITGDYSCTGDLPVMLYAFGGAPTLANGSTATPPTPTFTVSSVALSTTGGVTTFTWTTSTPNLLYVGETFVPANFANNGATKGNFAYLDGAKQTVVTTPSATTFTTTTANGGNADKTYTSANLGSTVDVQSTPVGNKAVVNMATLGNCPSLTGGNFSSGPSKISYVYMNEVSTVATAFAFQGFTTAGHNNAFDIGSSSGSGQQLIGLQNAALTAGNLYNIQGSDQSMTYAGEGHIARAVTAAGNGIVPQTTLNTLANILANCVDSEYTATPPTASTQCQQLFNIATNNGVPRGSTGQGTAPFDTATAAINIARHPAGTGTVAAGVNSFTTGLYYLPTGVVPFSPTLTAVPNDFTVYIRYPLSAKAGNGVTVTNSFVGRAESIAVDSKGDVWATSQGDSASPQAFELSPTGALMCNYVNSYIFGYLALDINDNPWAGNANTTSGITKLTPAATSATCGVTSYAASTYHQAYTVVADGSGNTFFMPEKIGTTSAPFYIYEFPGASAVAPATPTFTPSSTPTSLGQPFGSADVIAHASLDNNAGGFWITNENGYTSTYGRVVASTGVPSFTLSTGGDGQPEFPAIDASNTAWIPIQASTGQVYQVSNSGGAATVTKFTNALTGAEFASSFGAAVDGNGDIWITNRGAIAPYYNAGVAGNNSIVELNSSGVAISPPTNYTLGGLLNDPLNIAGDPSGNLWITNYGGDQIVELVGAGYPVVTPLSVSSSTNKLGSLP